MGEVLDLGWVVGQGCHGAVEQTLREPGHGPVEVVEPLFDLVVGAVPVQRARGGIPLRVEFVQVPTQPVDQSGALPDQGRAGIAQPPDLAVGAVEPGGGQGRAPAAPARAAASASIGSDLPNVRAESRTWAISFGGTRAMR